MYRGSSILPIKYRKIFANALILPHVDYLDTIYGRASKSKLHELDIVYIQESCQNCTRCPKN